MRSKRDKMNDELVGILSEVVRHYVSHISCSNNLGTSYKSTKRIEKRRIEHYGFIPSNTLEVLGMLLKLYHHMEATRDEYKFLDIGCGIGNIVLSAYAAGFDAYGLEYNNKIYNIAKSVVSKNLSEKNRILKGDMMDFSRYGEYDVLYFYVPIANERAMYKFTDKLMKKMKYGTYVIPQGFRTPFHQSKEFELVKLQPHADWGYCKVYRKM